MGGGGVCYVKRENASNKLLPSQLNTNSTFLVKSQVENDKRDNFQQVQAKNQHVPRCLEYG